MTQILNTGERILLEKETPLMIARHFCAYKLAKDYCIDKTTLDVGCGEGYGSFYLAGFAREVVGIDYDKAIIDYAKSKYQKNKLQFLVMDAKGLSTFNNKFDIICSFQFIEHIHDVKNFLINVRSLLNDGGIFICSTPNRTDASPGKDMPLNKFHVKEYLWGEFRELLQTYFQNVDISGLKRGRKLNFYRKLKKIGLFNFLPPSLDLVKKFYNRITCENLIIVKDSIDKALDFIAICRK